MTIPIPKRPSGVLIGDPAAVVTIDVFVDLQCPHSKKLWPNLTELMAHYANQPVSLRTHLITLSNHRQAWDLSLGLLAYADGDANRFYQFASYLFAQQAQFYNAQFTDKTHADLQALIADMALEHGSVDRANFLRRMADEDIYIEGRTPIRYAATKAVWATPTLFINNAGKVPVDFSSSLDDWQNLIDPLL